MHLIILAALVLIYGYVNANWNAVLVAIGLVTASIALRYFRRVHGGYQLPEDILASGKFPPNYSKDPEAKGPDPPESVDAGITYGDNGQQ